MAELGSGVNLWSDQTVQVRSEINRIRDYKYVRSVIVDGEVAFI